MNCRYSQLRCVAAVFGWPRNLLRRYSLLNSKVTQDLLLDHHFSSCGTRNVFVGTNMHETLPQWADQASLYVHWPYCEKRCTYCNFNKYISRNVDHDQMKACLVKETKTLLQLSQVSLATSVFFGGGTPSLARPDTIAAVLDCVSQTTKLQPGAEVTLEANPTSTEMDKLREFQCAGVNRISLGVQTLRDCDLLLLGRQHSVSEALRCLEMAYHVFPGRVSMDIMFGRPGQTLQDWELELNEVLQVCDSHLSLYQLTLERGTALWKQVSRGHLALPDTTCMADMYETAVQMMEESGRLRYEASNFAKKGTESVHNRSYWQGDQYIGVGPGAHGRFIPLQEGIYERQARIQTLEPDPWMWEVKKYGHATRKIVQQTTRDMLLEYLMSGLRTQEGINDKRWQEFGAKSGLKEIFSSHEKLIQFQEEGFMELYDSGLHATHKGLNVIDSITPYLMNILEESQGFITGNTDRQS